jgi:hypothetical protein
LGDTESAYGGGATLVAGTHGIRLASPAVGTIEYAYGGERSPSTSSGGTTERTTPAGAFGSLPVAVEARGRGSAYSATDYAEDLHVLLQIAGHNATYSATPTPQWTYTPDSLPANVPSGAFEAYGRGEVYELIGTYAGFGLEMAGPGIAIANFDIQGLITTLPVDAALPSITLNTLKPPVAKDISVVIGNYTAAVVRSLTFSRNTDSGPRLDLNGTTGHAGFALGRRAAQTEIEIEAAALTTGGPPWTAAGTINPYELRDSAETFAFSWTLGSVQYNRIGFSAPQSQIAAVELSDDGPVATWRLTIEHHMTTPSADDEYAILIN